MAAMEKNNKNLNVPNLRFPEFSGEWERHSLGEIGSTLIGLTYSPADVVKEDGVIVLRSSNIQDGEIDYKDLVRVNKKIKDSLFTKKNDILICARNGSSRLIGKNALISDDDTGHSYGAFMMVYRSEANPYVRQLLCTKRYFAQVGENLGARINQITTSDMNSFEFFFPQSKEERNKIALFLRLIDERISTQKKIIEDLKKLKDAITHFHYKNELSHSPMVYIGQYITQVSKRNKDAKIDRVLSISNKYGFINQNEQFEDREVASADTSNYKVVHKGDFAYNPARINVGSVARLQEFENGIVSPMYVCFTAKKGLLPAYFELYLSTSIFKHEMNKRLEGSVRLCLTYESLCNIKIALPEFNVQKDFVSKVSAILTKIMAEERLLYLYHNCKQYLLSQMFI